jgi:hypothetical protein
LWQIFIPILFQIFIDIVNIHIGVLISLFRVDYGGSDAWLRPDEICIPCAIGYERWSGKQPYSCATAVIKPAKLHWIFKPFLTLKKVADFVGKYRTINIPADVMHELILEVNWNDSDMQYIVRWIVSDCIVVELLKEITIHHTIECLLHRYWKELCRRQLVSLQPNIV